MYADELEEEKKFKNFNSFQNFYDFQFLGQKHEKFKKKHKFHRKRSLAMHSGEKHACYAVVALTHTTRAIGKRGTLFLYFFLPFGGEIQWTGGVAEA